MRLYVNYQKLNKITKKNQHFLFLITKILNQLNGVKYFIKLDLKKAYHQIHIQKNDEQKMTFQMIYEYFEYQILFFELINAFTTFQTYINKILSELIDIRVFYLNNILIYFKNKNSHVKHVKQILNHFQKYDLYVKLNKCEFFKNIIEYFDFIIKNDNISMNFRQIKIIKD